MLIWLSCEKWEEKMSEGINALNLKHLQLTFLDQWNRFFCESKWSLKGTQKSDTIEVNMHPHHVPPYAFIYSLRHHRSFLSPIIETPNLLSSNSAQWYFAPQMVDISFSSATFWGWVDLLSFVSASGSLTLVLFGEVSVRDLLQNSWLFERASWWFALILSWSLQSILSQRWCSLGHWGFLALETPRR